MVTIAIETPLQDEVREMIVALNAYMKPLSPPEFQFQMTAEQMADEKTTVFVARNDIGEAIGMGSLKVETPQLAEVKRMYTKPEIRGERVGSKLLAEITKLADEKGIAELALETGEAEGFEGAYRLYENNGFTQCGAFLDYPDSGYSRFYKKKMK